MALQGYVAPRKWLISGEVAEISHCSSCNFFPESEFKYIGASDRDKIQKTCRFGGCGLEHGSGTRGTPCGI